MDQVSDRQQRKIISERLKLLKNDSLVDENVIMVKNIVI
jgi:hypothetical protein